jgi:hypothetical protein
MKRTFLAVALIVSLTAMSCAPADNHPTLPSTAAPTLSASFDDLGYNDVANIFNGAADGTDGVLDGKVWGDPTYAKDHLVMKWNKAWENCNANRTPANCAGAWLTNEWNGQVTGGSGEVWHYKFVWVGACGSYGTPLPDGSYCIWNEYAVVQSQGTFLNQHFWDAHARPQGFGRVG